jgi:hypothetical protein
MLNLILYYYYSKDSERHLQATEMKFILFTFAVLHCCQRHVRGKLKSPYATYTTENEKLNEEVEEDMKERGNRNITAPKLR